MRQEEQLEYELMKQKALEQLRSGKSLYGNRGNGRKSEDIRTSSGTISVQVPTNRISTFEPEIIRKRETILVGSLENKIIGMYGLG